MTQARRAPTEGVAVLTGVLALLIVFYAGAVLTSARSWLNVWRGRPRFSDLRDLTGIADQAAMLRSFGCASPGDLQKLTLSAILRHRRRTGVILTDLPVHAMFLLALGWAAFNIDAVSAAAIAWGAAAHAGIVAAVALSLVAGKSRALQD
jgi:hypothetical protein